MSGFVGKLVPFNVGELPKEKAKMNGCGCSTVVLVQNSTALRGRVRVARGRVLFCSSCMIFTGSRGSSIEVDGEVHRLGEGQQFQYVEEVGE